MESCVESTIMNGFIQEYKKFLDEKVSGYKVALQWAKERNRPKADIDAIESSLGAYQNCMFEFYNLLNEENA